MEENNIDYHFWGNVIINEENDKEQNINGDENDVDEKRNNNKKLHRLLLLTYKIKATVTNYKENSDHKNITNSNDSIFENKEESNNRDQEKNNNNNTISNIFANKYDINCTGKTKEMFTKRHHIIKINNHEINKENVCPIIVRLEEKIILLEEGNKYYKEYFTFVTIIIIDKYNNGNIMETWFSSSYAILK